MTDYVVFFTGLTFLLAGMVKGVVGMGLPTIAMGLLAEVMPPAEAAALLLIPSLVTNIWQLAAGRHCLSLARRMSLLLLGICIGTWAGSGLLAQDSRAGAAAALGATLLAYGVLGLAKIKLAVPLAWQPWLSGPIGAATGLVTAATGVFVIPAVPYLGALGLDRDDLVQALGLCFTVSTLALGGSLFFSGAVPESRLGISLLALLPAAIGLIAGQQLRRHLDAATFRLCFFLALLGLGADLLIRHLA